MIRRRRRQMALAQLALFGVVSSPEELFDVLIKRCTADDGLDAMSIAGGA